MNEELFSEEPAPEKKETPWSDVPGNALKDIKSGITQIADPLGISRSYADLAQGKSLPETTTGQKISSELESVKNAAQNPGETLSAIGKGIVEPFIHPVESFKRNPVNTGVSAAMMTGALPGMEVEPNKTLENAAKTKGLQSTGIGNKFLASMDPEEYEAAKNFVSENNLIGTSKEEVLQKALAKQKELGNALGEVGKKTELAGVKADYSDWEKAVGKLQDKLASTSDVEYKTIKDMAPRYEEAMDDVTNTLSKDSSWNSIQKLKQKFGDIAFDATGEIKDKPAADTYFALKNMLVDVTKKAQSDPNLPETYKNALAGYHTIDPVIEGLQKAVGAERAGAAGHGAGHGFLPRIIRSLPGQHNPAINLGTAAVATAVSPHLGPLMALPTLTNPAIQSRVFSGLANTLPLASRGVPGISQAVNEYLKKTYKKK